MLLQISLSQHLKMLLQRLAGVDEVNQILA